MIKPLSYDGRPDKRCRVSGIGDSNVAFHGVGYRILNLQIDIIHLDGVGAELAGLPVDRFRSRSEDFAEIDGPLARSAGEGVLDGQGDTAGNGLRDEPEGLGSVGVVQVLFVSCAIPGIAELVVRTGGIGLCAGVGAGGDSVVWCSRFGRPAGHTCGRIMWSCYPCSWSRRWG